MGVAIDALMRARQVRKDVIEECNSKIEAAQSLRQQAIKEIDALDRAVALVNSE